MEKAEIKQARTKLEDAVPRPAPFVVYLDPCGACNFKCSFCPCNTSDFMLAERHKIMEWELFEKILRDLQAFQGQICVINLHGFGEPLLNPRIADMVRALKENRCCREVRLTTNGSLLGGEMGRALIDAGIDLVRVSVEAVSAAGYRELCGVDADFSEIVRNIEAFYRLARSRGGSKISAKIFSASLKTPEDEQRFHALFAPITDFHYIEHIEPIWSEFGQTPPAAAEAYSRCYPAGQRREVCSFPFTDMCIHSNGAVGACCSDWKFATQYGDARRERLADIWNGKRHKAVQCAHLSMQLSPFCAACQRKPMDRIEDPELLKKRIMKE